jgi:hypothetical protein
VCHVIRNIGTKNAWNAFTTVNYDKREGHMVNVASGLHARPCRCRRVRGSSLRGGRDGVLQTATPTHTEIYEI